MNKKISLLVFVLLLGLSSYSAATSNYVRSKLEATYKLLDEGQYVLAMKRFKTLAQSSVNADAQYHIGYMYHNGLGVQVDYREAALWYSYAASQRHRNAQNNLYILYMNGYGNLNKDTKLAIKWLIKASDGGSAMAQANLARHYVKGDYVNKDVYHAFDLVRKSSYKGNISGRSLLANYYLKGVGTKKRLTKSFSLYHNIALKKDSTHNEHQIAQIQIADMYLSGVGVENSYEDAYFWYLIASEGKNKEVSRLAKIQSNKIEKKLSKKVMFDLQEKAIKFHINKSNLNKVKYNTKSQKDKRRIFLDSAEEIISECKNELVNKLEPSECIRKLANSGNIEAQAQLGLWYFQGRIMAKNEEMAIYWLTKAAFQGHVDSMRRMGQLHGIHERFVKMCSWVLVARSYGDTSVNKFKADCLKMLNRDEQNFAESFAKKIHWEIKNFNEYDIDIENIVVLPNDRRVKNTTDDIQKIINSFLNKKRLYGRTQVTVNFNGLYLPQSLQNISNYIIFNFDIEKSCWDKKVNLKFEAQEWGKVLYKVLKKIGAKFFIEQGGMTVYGCS